MTQFNSRLQPTQIALGTTQNGADLLKLEYGYGTDNNGNVVSQTITVPGVAHPFVQAYAYDELNRLTTATETQNLVQTWKQAFTFDRFGNRNFDEANTTTLPKNCGTSPNFSVCTAERKIVNPSVNTANNRLSTSDNYAFDNSGNTTGDAEGRTFVYDAENKQISVSDANGTIGEYSYDGDGKRIKKYVPSTGEVTVFVYDAGSKLIGEYSTVVQTGSNAKTVYTTNDHLGSPRINTDGVGAVISRHDYHPFGEEIARTGYGSDTIRNQFTGYERDMETGLDFAQARYFVSLHGRFSSPDSFTNDTHQVKPQSWNLYGYARNNPLRFTDPTGEKVRVISRRDEETGRTIIMISGSFAMYAAEGQNVTAEDMARQARLLSEAIQTHYTNQNFSANGINFTVESNLTVSVVGSEQDAINSGADNLIEVGTDAMTTDEGQSLRGNAFQRPGGNFDRIKMSINPAEGRSDAEYIRDWGHEIAHPMGGSDERRGLLESGGYGNFMTEENWVDLFTAPQYRAFGSQAPPSHPTAARTHVTVGAEYTLKSNILSGLPTLEHRRTNGAENSAWVKRTKN